MDRRRQRVIFAPTTRKTQILILYDLFFEPFIHLYTYLCGKQKRFLGYFKITIYLFLGEPTLQPYHNHRFNSFPFVKNLGRLPFSVFSGLKGVYWCFKHYSHFTLPNTYHF